MAVACVHGTGTNQLGTIAPRFSTTKPAGECDVCGENAAALTTGPFAGVWLLVCPTTDGLQFTNEEIQCGVRRRLGIGIITGSPDPHGHALLATSLGGRTQARHTEMVAAWRQVLVEAGAIIPDKNIERVLHRTHIPVPQHYQRRIDIIAPCLNIAQGLPLFCDVTVLSPISANGAARPGTSNYGGKLPTTKFRKAG